MWLKDAPKEDGLYIVVLAAGSELGETSVVRLYDGYLYVIGYYGKHSVNEVKWWWSDPIYMPDPPAPDYQPPVPKTEEEKHKESEERFQRAVKESDEACKRAKRIIAAKSTARQLPDTNNGEYGWTSSKFWKGLFS